VTAGQPWRLTGRLSVALPPAAAFRLFTARGEREWADGWEPRFPAPVADDTAPGVVWETGHDDEHTVWLVLGSDRGRSISYARVTPHDRAGTVTVVLDDAPGGGSDVEVTYVLTALTAEADERLAGFAAGYAGFLADWERDVAAHLAGQAGRGTP
jgi:hypothetical protein